MLKNFLFAAFQLAFVILCFLLALSCLDGRAQWLELTTHFKLQYFGAALLAALVFAAGRAWRWFGAACVAALISGSSLFGWYWPTAANPTELAGAPKLRLLLANVLYDNAQHQAVLELVQRENPDVIVFQEFTPAWEQGTKALRATYPHDLFEARNHPGGIAALSRLPLKSATEIDTGNYLGPTLQLEIPLAGQVLTLVTAHPPPPNGFGFEARNLQLQRLAAHLKTLPGPKVLLGDLNTTVWSPYLKDFTRDSGLRNARGGFGLVPTWPTFWYLWPLQIGIDQCFVGSELQVLTLRTGSAIGSDHRPLVVDLALVAGR